MITDLNAIMTDVEQNQTLSLMLELYQRLSQNETNLFFSPFSISTVMSMVLLGAKGNTAVELIKGLGYSDKCESTIHSANLERLKKISGISKILTLETANKLFPEITFEMEQEFINGCKSSYLSTVEGVNFINKANEARSAINAWAEKQTKGKIQNLLPEGSVSSNTRLVLVNAVYFKGDWQNKFDPKHTSQAKFHVNEKHSLSVEMMSRSGKYNINFDQTLGVQVVELPYKGGDVSMIILLPSEKFGLKKLEKQLTSSKLQALTENFFNEKIDLALPKMKLEHSFDVVDTLKQMGISDVFDESRADLSGMSGTKGLFVSNVFHKAFVEVNEEGSEAAAATAAVVMLRAALIPVRIICDHPFMFVLKHRPSQTILFCGRYVSP